MAASEVVFTNGSAPATPASGKTLIYSVNLGPFLLAQNRPCFINDTGANVELSGGEANNQGNTNSSSDPAGTTSTTGVMMGVGLVTIPRTTGIERITMSGWMTNSTIADGAFVQIRYGLGLLPANGAALTGTAIGSQVNMIAGGAGFKMPFALQALVTGLTLRTTYWVDVSLAAVTGGTATIGGLSFSLFEI